MVVNSKTIATMKNLFTRLMLVAVAAMGIMACQTEPEIIFVPEAKDVVMTITAGMDDTRTWIDETNYKVQWSEGDKLKVFQNTTAATSKEAVIDADGNAKFTVAFAEDPESVDFTYNAVYPVSSWVDNNNTIMENMKLIIPAAQNPMVESFDPNADLLIAKPINTSEQAESLNMQFKRMVALGKMSLVLPEEATTISEVVFSAIAATDVDPKIVAGRNRVDIITGTVVTEGYYGATNTLTLSYENVPASTPVYFTCNPFELVSGEKFSVKVVCNNGTYTREVIIPDSRSLIFSIGDLTTFSVNLTTDDTIFDELVVDTTGYSYKRITSSADLTDGEYIIAALSGDTYYALPSTTTIKSNKIGGERLTVANNEVLSANATGKVWTINKSNSGYTIYNGTKYLCYTSSTNIGVDDTADSWIPSFEGQGWKMIAEETAEGIAAVGTTERCLLFSKGSINKFGGYAVSNYTNDSYAPIQLFKKMAEGETISATLSFASKDQRTYFDLEKQIWEQNGITFTNNMASGNTYLSDIANPVRLYKDSEVVIAAPGYGYITQIVFDCDDTNDDADYMTALKNYITTGTVSVSGDKVTVTFGGLSNTGTYTIDKLSSQVRLDSLTIYYIR